MPPVTEIEHPSHPGHKLKLKPPRVPYHCHGCKELDFDICYQCEKCKDFYIHKDCANPKNPIIHHFFKESDRKFEFYNVSPIPNRECDACGMDIKGNLYQSNRKKYDMHPHCANLPETLTGENVTLELKKKESKKCQKCHLKTGSEDGPKGWCYVSTCGKYRLHVACVKQLVYKAWQDDFFSEKSEGISSANTNALALASVAGPSTSTAIVERRENKSVPGWKIALLVTKLILSAVFGEPISGFTALIATLADNFYT